MASDAAMLQYGLDGEIFGQLESRAHGACVRGDFSRVSTSPYAEFGTEYRAGRGGQILDL